VDIINKTKLNSLNLEGTKAELS